MFMCSTSRQERRIQSFLRASWAALHINQRFTQHNHPSNVLTPSFEDDDVTRKIARAGALLCVPLLDHVILSPDGGFYSYKNDRPDCLDGGGSL